MRGIVNEGIRGGRWVVAGIAWCLWATACAEPEDWELTEIAADEQVELLMDADEEDEEAALAPGAVEPTIATHVEADGSLAGCSGGTLASAKLSPGRHQASCAGQGSAEANAQVVAHGVGANGERTPAPGSAR